MGYSTRPRPAGRHYRRAGDMVRLLAGLLLGTLVALAGAGLDGTPVSGATPAASRAQGQGVVFESVSLVVRMEPEAGGLGVLVLARARNTGTEPAGRVYLPWFEAAGLVSSGQSSQLAVEGGRLYDGRPLAPRAERDYTYQVRIDSRATQGRLHLSLPAPVEHIYLFTQDGELVARSEGLADRGPVDGAEIGAPGVRLRLYEGGALAAGASLAIAVMPAGMPGGSGGSGGGTAGEGGPGGTGAAGTPGSSAPGVPAAPGMPGAGPAVSHAAVWLGWLAVLAAGAGGLALISRRRRAGVGGLIRRRRALIREIVALDRAYADGELDAALYAQERERLRREAVALTLRIEEQAGRAGRRGAATAAGAGAGTAPAGSGGEAPAR